jgi:hypothetical protein
MLKQVSQEREVQVPSAPNTMKCFLIGEIVASPLPDRSTADLTALTYKKVTRLKAVTEMLVVRYLHCQEISCINVIPLDVHISQVWNERQSTTLPSVEHLA